MKSQFLMKAKRVLQVLNIHSYFMSMSYTAITTKFTQYYPTSFSDVSTKGIV